MVTTRAISDTTVEKGNIDLWIPSFHEVRGLWGKTYIEDFSWGTGSKCVKHCFAHCDQPWYSSTCLHCCIVLVVQIHPIQLVLNDKHGQVLTNSC